ncbi:DNA-binding XRE family transcriptional regulator [Variovorax sp. OAS795]|uniref:helix-turn-helix domain-containing protein n=1 Tax=Variovorax sp. OAS795 TaxID=3034231 RepID=UPI003396719F
MKLHPVEVYAVQLDHCCMVKTGTSDKQMAPELVAFGAAVRRRRKDLGYSQEPFGDFCGIDRSYMGGIERGEHNLALINILKIIEGLGVQPSEFFRDLDKPSGPVRKGSR